MKWESLNLHLENLLPGLLTFILVALLLPDTFQDHFVAEPAKTLVANEFIAGGIFVATAYMLGVLAVVISRLAVDRPSEYFPRPLLLRLLSRGRLGGKSFKIINEQYRAKIKEVLAGQNEEIKKEVLKRRETGRLIRTALVPTLLIVVVATKGQSLCMRSLLASVAFAVFLFLYAYVEATIYEECLFADDTN